MRFRTCPSERLTRAASCFGVSKRSSIVTTLHYGNDHPHRPRSACSARRAASGEVRGRSTDPLRLRRLGAARPLLGRRARPLPLPEGCSHVVSMPPPPQLHLFIPTSLAPIPT